MKKNIVKSIVFFLACLVIFNVNAQKAYFNISAGYGLKVSSQNLSDLYMFNYTTKDNSVMQEQINLSLGKGFTVEGNFGYKFGKNLGAEMGISYLTGDKTNSKFIYTEGSNNYSISAQMIRINPSFIITGNSEKINPYGKLGLIVGFGAIMHEGISNLANIEEVKTTKLNGGAAFGVSAGMGTITKLTNSISLINELTMINLSYAPNKGNVTKYTLNGENKLDNLAVSERKTDFYDSCPVKVINSENPRFALKQKLPFGSVGIKVGIQINL